MAGIHGVLTERGDLRHGVKAGEAKYRAAKGAAINRCAVQVAVMALNEAGKRYRAVAAAEGMQQGERAGHGYPVHRPLMFPVLSLTCGAVKEIVGGREQAVCARAVGAIEGVERR